MISWGVFKEDFVVPGSYNPSNKRTVMMYLRLRKLNS